MYNSNLTIYCNMMERISWIDHARNEEELHRFQEEKNILRTIKRRSTGLVTSYAGNAF